ncbi:hypothetical protein PS15p_209747 [Mucor circinelloides]
MSRLFANIPDWITEESDKRLNALVSNEKLTRIKLAMHICDERQTEFVIMELADDSFFIPAMFKPDDIRRKFGLSDLQLSIDTLEERILKIKTYAISAYRCNNSLYPYLIVTDFEYIKGRSRIDNDLQHVYTMKRVEDWIDHVQQHIQSLHDPVSKMFPSSALTAQYRNLDTFECQLEAILPRMYRFEARVPVNNSREIERLHSPRNRVEQDDVDYASNINTPLGAHKSMNRDIARDEELVTTSHVMPSTANHPSQAEIRSRASPVRLTLQAYLVSTFDTMEEIPDEICIDSEDPELKVKTQAGAHPPRSPTSSPNLSTTSPRLNKSPATAVTAKFTPDPLPSYPFYYSLGASNTSDPMDSSNAAIPNSSLLLGRAYELKRVPEHFDSFKRRRLFSDYRLEYLK